MLTYAKDLISDPDLPETINGEEYFAIFQDFLGEGGVIHGFDVHAMSARRTDIDVENKLRCVLALLALPPDHWAISRHVKPGEREQWALWALENDPLEQEDVDPARAAWLAEVLAEQQ